MRKIRIKILLFFKPVQIFMQKLGRQDSQFTYDVIDQLVEKIKPGDVLLSYEAGRFTSWFIKGEWDHAAIVNDQMRVVEAVGDYFVKGKNIGGVRSVNLKDWISQKNEIIILRHPHRALALKAAIASSAQIGKSYDYSFSLSNECLYCSELVYVCYRLFDKEFMAKISDNDDILPIDYLKEPRLNTVYNSRTYELV